MNDQTKLDQIESMIRQGNKAAEACSDVDPIVCSLFDVPPFDVFWGLLCSVDRAEFKQILSDEVAKKIAAREREILIKLAEVI